MTIGRNARAGLPQLFRARPDRVGRDRLEILTALIDAPSFDPIFRPDVIVIPRDHPVYRWTCVVDCCERSRNGSSDLCAEHLRQLADARARGVGRAEFITTATGLDTPIRAEEIMCRVCPERPADQAEIRLCRLHWHRWQKQRKTLGEDADFAVWLAGQDPLPGYGRCVVAVCVNLAESPLGMCQWHRRRYTREGRAGGATLPSLWDRCERRGEPVPIEYVDEQAFRGWCAAAPAPWWPGQANLKGLRPLVRAEFKWGLFIQSQRARPRRWDLVWLRSLIDSCRAQDLESLIAYQLVVANTRISPTPSSRRSCTNYDWSTSPRPRRRSPGSSRPITTACGSLIAVVTSI
jgi:hypothetical protein